MHEQHRQAAEEHECGARAHRTAAEHNEKARKSKASGMRSEPWNIPITHTNLRRKRTTNLVK